MKATDIPIFGIKDSWDPWVTKDNQVSRSTPADIKEEIFLYRVSVACPTAVIAKGQFKDSNSKIEVKCIKCGTTSFRLPKHLVSGHGCALCRNNSHRKTIEVFKEDLKNIHGNKILHHSGEYVNNYTPISLVCSECENTWETQPRTVLSGYGCPTCSYVAQDKVYLAYEKESGLYKVGITKNPKIRMYEIRSVILQYCWEVGIDNARKEEQKVQVDFKDKRTTSVLANCGYTEFYSFTEEDIGYLINYFNSKYQIYH